MKLGYKTITSGHGKLYKPAVYVEPKSYLFGLIKVKGHWEELSEYGYDMDMDRVNTFFEETKVKDYLNRYAGKLEQQRISEELYKIPVEITYTDFK